MTGSFVLESGTGDCVTLLLWIAIAGLLGSGIYLALALIAAFRFSRRNRQEPVTRTPGVTLLKPVCGDEPRLRENLESFFRQSYPNFEIIFGARHASDPALRVVRDLQREYPEVAATIVLSGEPLHANAKVCALEQMVSEARFEYLVISDSDVEVASDYVHSVVQPLLDPAVGLVTCLYRGVHTGSFWSRLEALGMSVEMTSGVLIAELLEGMKFALGPTMATRKDVLDSIGGIGGLADYCSDDYLLGQWVARAGYKVHLSRHVIGHVAMNRGLLQSVLHQVRWMKSTRCSRPLGHLGTGLTFAMPFALLGFVVALRGGHVELACALLAIGCLNRLVQALAAGGVVNDREAIRHCWLYPVRDLLGFAFWLWSLVGGRSIVWRGQRYRLLRHGEMVPEELVTMVPQTHAAPEPQPAEVSQ